MLMKETASTSSTSRRVCPSPPNLRPDRPTLYLLFNLHFNVVKVLRLICTVRPLQLRRQLPGTPPLPLGVIVDFFQAGTIPWFTPIFNTAPSRPHLDIIFPGVLGFWCTPFSFRKYLMHAVLFSGVLDVRHSIFGRTRCTPFSIRTYSVYAALFSGVLDVCRSPFGRTWSTPSVSPFLAPHFRVRLVCDTLSLTHVHFLTQLSPVVLYSGRVRLPVSSTWC